MKPLLLLFTLLLASASLGAAPPPASPLPFSGATLDGRRFDLAARRGRVVMVVLWRSTCPVCIDKLPELRINARGWKDAPFDLVLVNLDASPADAERYDRARRILAPGEASVFSFWQGQAQMPGPWRSPDRLPHTVIIDRQGAVAAQFEGRIPAEAWNQVADLLP
ncbi:TlpA disulfide reductase family protein [Aquabacterium sp. OR-4]|uniref:TlpA disulfide reductase family protein n=1 Tax=Aquabacterium sp. OR-4 TaxID=2978127 RepID=UPI0021B382FF|nr:TlpA disulfide reductase family protein [Aquabacterium sp. OR-4]MDT7836114.1 TlpA disulfide reductase family protein [Aquabacterium sp. OR-4]